MLIEQSILCLAWCLTFLPPQDAGRAEVTEPRAMSCQVPGTLRLPTLYRLSGWG
jgi:hypothetical protein